MRVSICTSMLITLWLSQPVSAAGPDCNAVSSAGVETQQCVKDESAPRNSSKYLQEVYEEFYEDPSDTSEGSCVIECDACISGGFTPTCDQLV